MSPLNIDLWAHILSFLYKDPPRNEHSDKLVERWSDYSQANLARCMRVSAVFHCAASTHLYRAVTVLSLPLLLYGIDRSPSETDHTDSNRDHKLAQTGTLSRASKAHLLSLVRSLHVLQPKVYICSDIAHRISFWGWCSLDAEDSAIALEAVNAVLGPVAAMWEQGTVLPTTACPAVAAADTGRKDEVDRRAVRGILPNLTRVEVSSCDHYTWTSLDLGGASIPAYQDLLDTCRQVMLALVAPWLYREGAEPSHIEWVQRTANGPFVFPRARIAEAEKTGDGAHSGVFDGRYEIDLIAEELFARPQHPAMRRGGWNEVYLRRRIWEKRGEARILAKMLGMVYEDITADGEGEIDEMTVVEFFGPYRADEQGKMRCLKRTADETAALLRDIEDVVGPRWWGRIKLS